MRSYQRMNFVMTTTAVVTGLLVLASHATVFAQPEQVAESLQVQEAFKNLDSAEAARQLEAAADSSRRAADAQARARSAASQTAAPPTDTAPAPTQSTDTVAIDTNATSAAPANTQAAKSDSLERPAVGRDQATTPPGRSTADTAKSSEATPADTTGTPAAQIEAEPAKPLDPTAPYKEIQFAAGEKPRVVVETSMGNVVVELWPDVAPKSCQSFMYLVGSGFYDSLIVHRVVPGFLIQAGDPTGTGTGGPGYSVPSEFSSKVVHEDGTLSLARRVDPQAKTGGAERPEYLNSAGSQFFICLDRTSSLDGKFTIFGKVVEGLNIVHRIAGSPAQRERPTTPVFMTKVHPERQS